MNPDLLRILVIIALQAYNVNKSPAQPPIVNSDAKSSALAIASHVATTVAVTRPNWILAPFRVIGNGVKFLFLPDRGKGQIIVDLADRGVINQLSGGELLQVVWGILSHPVVVKGSICGVVIAGSVVCISNISSIKQMLSKSKLNEVNDMNINLNELSNALLLSRGDKIKAVINQIAQLNNSQLSSYEKKRKLIRYRSLLEKLVYDVDYEFSSEDLNNPF